MDLGTGKLAAQLGRRGIASRLRSGRDDELAQSALEELAAALEPEARAAARDKGCLALEGSTQWDRGDAVEYLFG
jgi:hypothetical protein